MLAAALSIQDPRERPAEQLDAANAAHKRFDVAGSDLLSIVALWDHLRAQQRALSGNQFRRLCRTEFLNYLRVREWQDLFSQLRQVAGDLGIRPPQEDARPGPHPPGVLAGLLSHIGMRDRRAAASSAARAGSTFTIARGSVLARQPPRWVMAAELVETNRLWARRVAAIEPDWAERLGAHLVRRSYGEPRWDERRGAAVTTETVTLYGLPIVSGRTGALRPGRPRRARASCSSATPSCSGEWSTHHGFVERNRAFRERVQGLEARVRRGHLLDDDELHAFYDERVPRRGHVRSPLRPLVAAARRPARPRPHRRRPRRRRRLPTGRLPRHVAPGRPRAAAVVPLRPRRAARRRRRARPADRAQPGHRRGLRLADPRLPGRARRRPRAHAAQGHPARADPDDRDRSPPSLGALGRAARPPRRRPRRGAARVSRRGGASPTCSTPGPSRPTCG